ncbi:hypothetical protein EJV47_04520 [Hymenobacter gummosus]|uniref:Uncharacterized protein n=1 Tax=Hymenobacter gummosus TaxID=1776032 RepID=A0A3S0K7N1_9BACT|nr:hypothetical protein [Hymenobacter gummosus]RTQ52291.1 hypothetical protein EJV47_04520 [Hymenobacter gummosus]
MDDSLLTSEAQRWICCFAGVFNGYTYCEQHWGLTGPPMHQRFGELLQHTSTTGSLSPRLADNFAINFYQHRMFRHWGYLPAAYTPAWHNMVLYYLHLYRAPIPAGYPTGEEDSPHSWAARDKGAAEATAAEIRRLLIRR